MHIKQLDITGVRNLKPLRLHFSPGFNAFYGENGSGKTSLLEAIYVLGVGRSFRTSLLQQVVSFADSNYVVSGLLVDDLLDDGVISFRAGTEKKKDNSKALFLKNSEKSTIGEIAKLLPLLLINSTSFDLIDGGPSFRRAFIDFGMFHVEHFFLDVFHKFKRCLAQRNAELKADIALSQKRKQVEAWNEAFIATAEKINAARKEFILDFSEIFNELISGWKYYDHVAFQYKQGWDDDVPLKKALDDSFMLDLMSGHTSRGPHRGELEIFVDGVIAKNILSRGQQKIFACAMILAKAVFLQKRAGIDSIFLVDDLNSELDQASFRLIVDKLAEIGGQVFITGIEKQPLLNVIRELLSSFDTKLFHVEQFGNISVDEVIY